MKYRHLPVFVCLLACLYGCTRHEAVRNDVPQAADIARRCNDDLRKLREEVERLAKSLEALYARRVEIVKKVDITKYTSSPNGAFYKPVDDGGASLWISAFNPVTPEIQEVAYLSEPIDPELKRICRDFPAICQAYYNDRHSLNRIYPWVDTIAQYPPRMNIPDYNFYYLADTLHNPERKGVWVSEPYVDPAGRGWMVTTMAPVYVNGRLEGVPGLDVTIATLVDRYFSGLDRSIAVVSREGVLVAATERAIQDLQMPPLKDHKYLETVRMDTFKPDEYNVLKSTLRPIRTMARMLLVEHSDAVKVSIDDRLYRATAAVVPELGWTVIELQPN